MAAHICPAGSASGSQSALGPIADRQLSSAQLRNQTSGHDVADSFAQGIEPSLLRGKAEELKRKKEDLLKALEFTPKAPIFVHPDMGGRYREAVRAIVRTFGHDDHKEGNADRIPGLLSTIVLTPNSDRSDLKIDVLGDMEGIIAWPRQITSLPHKALPGWRSNQS